MSLSYFTIFNPSMGPDEDSLPNQLIFYTSATTSDVDSQLRNIGLVQGIVELGKSFSRTNAEPIHCVKSKDTRSYLFELEAGFWAVVCLSVMTDDGTRTRDMPTTLQVQRQMNLAYKQFVLEHHGFEDSFERNSREIAIRIIESWWIRWVWSQDFLNQDAINLTDSAPQTQVELSRHGQQELKDWVSQLLSSQEIGHPTVSFVLEDGYLWGPSSTTLRPSDYTCLYQCVRQHILQQQHKGGPEIDKISTADADPNGTNYAWLSANKWSTETVRLFSSMTFKNRISTPDETREESSQIGEYIYKDFRTVYLQAADQAGEMHETNMNIFRFNTTYIIITMDSDVASIWSRLETRLTEMMPRFPHHLLKMRPINPPLFFSLISVAATGETYSKLPSLASAQVELATDTVLQKQVKENTIHLHRQIYEICSRNVTESVVKTSKNIWIIVRKDSEGLVVLCKSSKSGETMEEIEREGQLWINKLRRSHRPSTH